MAASRPNVVVFVPDQLRADCVGAFGNPVVRTPNIDALAARGARFDNAYVQHPVCSPSRASFLTGWYPHVAGHRTLTHLLQPGEPNFLKTYKRNGYRVVWAGARGDTFAPSATEVSVDEYGFTEPPSRGVGGITDFPDDLSARLFYRGRIEGSADRLDFDEAAVRTVEHWLQTRPSGPWLLFVPILAPHCPFAVTEPWFSMYERSEVPDPALRPGPDDGREPAFHQAIRDAYGLDRASAETWREVVATYYGMISRMDAHFGRVIAAVEACGAGPNTITAFFADHGEYLGDYGLIEKWPSAMSGNITRDPLILAGPGIPAGRVVPDMVEIIDVFPTLLDLTDVPDDTHRHYGRSLTDVLHHAGTHRCYAFTEGGFTVDEEPQLERPPFPYDLKGELQHRDPRLVGKAIAVRDQRYTYVERLYEPPELYDRSVDPTERLNLGGRPEYAEVEQRLRDAVLQWLHETGDVVPYHEDPRFPDIALPTPGHDLADHS